MSKQVLLNHLTNDPDNRGYSNMTAAEVAADLQVKRHASDFEAGIIGIIAYAGRDAATQLLTALDTVSASDVVVAKVLKVLENYGTVNVNDPVLVATLDAFVTGGLLSQVNRDAIVNIAANKKSDAEKYSLGNVKEGQVLAVRGY